MLKQFKTDRSDYSLILISAFCVLAHMQAADQFKGLDQNRYDAPIVKLLYDWTGEQAVKDSFLKLQPDDRAGHMHTLFTMFADEDIDVKIPSLSSIEAILAVSRLLHFADTFDMFADTRMREAFFAVPYTGARTEPMFGKALSDFGFPMERIKLWFPQEEPEENKQRMLAFLNNYTSFIPDDIAQRMIEVCEHIGFDRWDEVAPRIRSIVNGTINKADEQKIKTVLSGYGIKCKRECSPLLIEECRKNLFDVLITRLSAEPNVEALHTVATFLCDNRHIFPVSECLETCFFNMRDIHRGQKKTFELDLALFRSYVLSLHFRYDKKVLYNSFSYVRRFLNVCDMFSDEQFARACQMLFADDQFQFFYERSVRALQEYVKAHPVDEAGVKKSIKGLSVAGKGLHMLGVEQLIQEEVGRRGVARDRINGLLNMWEHNAHARGASLFSVLLKQCDLWSEQSDAETSGASPYSCSSGN